MIRRHQTLKVSLHREGKRSGTAFRVSVEVRHERRSSQGLLRYCKLMKYYFQLVHGCLLIHVYILINIFTPICSVIRAYALSDKNPSVYVLTHEHVCVYVLGYKHLCVYVFTYKHLCVYVLTYINISHFSRV